MVDIILASTSPRRKELLEQIGIHPRVVASEVPEGVFTSSEPQRIVEELALLKAQAVAAQLDHGLVVGGDTVVVLGERILGKPAGYREAFQMLELLSAKKHNVISGLALVDARTGRHTVIHETTAVYFRNLTSKEIDNYVKSGEPLDKAGSYGIQGLGAALVEKIEGCYFNVVGLPLVRLVVLLRQYGVEVL